MAPHGSLGVLNLMDPSSFWDRVFGMGHMEGKWAEKQWHHILGLASGLVLGMIMLLFCSVAHPSHTVCIFNVVGKARFPVGHFSPLAVKARRRLFRFCEGTHPRLCAKIPTISIALQLLLDRCYTFLYMLSLKNKAVLCKISYFKKMMMVKIALLYCQDFFVRSKVFTTNNGVIFK